MKVRPISKGLINSTNFHIQYVFLIIKFWRESGNHILDVVGEQAAAKSGVR